MALHSTSSAHCSSINCSNRQSSRPDLSFFRFPTTAERCQQWVQNTRRVDLQNKTAGYLSTNCRLCSEHFELKHFSNKQTKNRLNWNAVPTVFRLQNPLSCLYNPRKRKIDDISTPKAQEVVYIVTDHTYCKAPESDHFDVANVAQQLKHSMDSVSSSDLIQRASAFLEEPALTFFASQLRNSSRRLCKAKGRRWTNKQQLMALSLYHQSPSAYQFCLHIFTLPSLSSLRKGLSNVEVKPGFPPKVFELLRHKVGSMTERNKLCVITFGEMSLRTGLSYNSTEDVVDGLEDFGSLGKTSEPANHALVFMVRGLIGKWTQPIGYFLSRDARCAEKMKKLLNECIRNVKNTGLQPKAVVCDQGSSNVRLYKLLSVTEKRPFFMQGVDKIFCLYDVPHLLTNTRSNLQKFVFQMIGEDVCKPIRWRYIRNFYEFDSRLAIRKAHKLTKGHFERSNFTKMRVNEAAQVLSHSVAAGMYTYAAFDKLPAEAAYTAEFVEMINNLFDAFNSRCLKDPQKLRRPLSDNSEHQSFFESCLPILKSLKVVGGKNVVFIKGWCLAISCVSMLWQHLKETTDVRFLMTSHLNQDIVKDMFSTLQGKGGFTDKPSAKEFHSAFRAVMVDTLIKPVAGSKCSLDSDKFVQTLCSLVSNTERIKQSQRVNNVRKAIAVNNIQIDSPKQNTLASIAGYLCRKVITGHEVLSRCLTCRKALLKQAYRTLMVPSKCFRAFCAECDKCFRTEFNDITMTRSNISHRINHAMRDLDLYKKLHVCSDRIKAKIIAIFVNVRIHHVLKLKNREIHDVPPKSKRRKLQTVGPK